MELLRVNSILFCIICTSYGQVTKDAPPKILSMSPIDIDKPETYAVSALADTSLVNRLSCEASNADSIYWMYKPDVDSELTRTFDMQSTVVAKNGTNIRLEVNDAQLANSPYRSIINGYYQCYAANKFGYVTPSPVIRLLYASVQTDPYLDATKIEVVDYMPARLPCYQDNPLVKLVPSDAQDYPEVVLGYRWIIRGGFSDDKQLLTSNSPDPTGRLRLEPRLGSLFFTSVNSTLGDATRANYDYYMCETVVGTGLRLVTNKISLTISANPTLAGVQNAVNLYPETAEEGQVVCVETKDCKIPCLFGGRLADNANSILDVKQPKGSTGPVDTTSYGLLLKAVVTQQAGDWKCLLKSAKTGLVTASSANINVTVLAYPRLKSPDSFKTQFVKSGSRVTFDCSLKNLGTGVQEYLINGKVVKPDTPGVEYTTDELTFTNVSRNDSASVSCSATNTAGSFFKAVQLNVYDAPVIEYYPTESISVSADANATLEWDFNCTFVLDAKTDKDSVDLYFLSTKPGEDDISFRTGDSSKNKRAVTSVIATYSDATHTASGKMKVKPTTSADMNDLRDGTKFRCVLEYQLLGYQQKEQTDLIGFTFIRPKTPVAPSSLNYLCNLLTGVILGLTFLIVFPIILMYWYMKRGLGDLPVSINNENEMQVYGGLEYKRVQPSSLGYK